MNIRANSNSKDRLSEKASLGALALVRSPLPGAANDELRFYTSHPTKPCLVDLYEFKTGQRSLINGKISQLGFKGRPELIAQLAPALNDQLSPLAEPTVNQWLYSLRRFWRLFDSIESADPKLPSLTSVAGLTSLHEQSAVDEISRSTYFNMFTRIASITRMAMGLKPLYWRCKEDVAPVRHLPPDWQLSVVRQELKHQWYAVIDRWELCDRLRETGRPLVNSDEDAFESQSVLLRNLARFDRRVAETGNVRPSWEELVESQTERKFYGEGLNVAVMIRSRYPDGDDIRKAFHLCLAITGWNAAVLLGLDVNKPFIQAHPKNADRFVIRGMKQRGGIEQYHEGLFKSQSGAAFIINTLMERTAPLRNLLFGELQNCRDEVENKTMAGIAISALLRRRLIQLEQGLRSPWLYAATNAGVRWLNDANFASGLAESGRQKFLAAFIETLNEQRPKDRQLEAMSASDLRDAYAAHIYRASGGSILAVMKALGHRGVRNTRRYLHNTLLREEHRKLLGTFSSALWDGLERRGEIDPTVIAKFSRDGEVTDDQRQRLHDYRDLMRSRIGIACKDPINPPRHVDPSFRRDGQSVCRVQRCTLCFDNAIILPSSFPGLCKRYAELCYIRARMAVMAFQQSSFYEELDNTELALLAFAADEVKHEIDHWGRLLENGGHRVIDFDGIGGEVQ